MVFCWLRRDLRLHDHAALYHALKNNNEVLPLFIFDENILSELPEIDRRVDFIHQVLENIKTDLRRIGSDILIEHGTPEDVWKKLIDQYEPKAVYANHDYEPYARERDSRVKEILASRQIPFYTFKDQTIFEKDEIVKDDGSPYTVFTPYSKRCKEKLKPFFYKSYPTEKYFSSFKKITEPFKFPTLDELGFRKTDIQFKFPELPSEELLLHYKECRDFPGIHGTSRLSVHLRFGTISIRKLVQQALHAGSESYLNELIWRDFYMMILWHFPYVVHSAFKKEYDHIPWENNEVYFERWTMGKTGVPMVDAGMRELMATGYMHNRVRMITASFLTKNLLIDWRWGEAWFARLLNDFDLSANNGGWQWSASTGCDAAPYFRIFNPVEQQKKFDPEFKYIKKWIPEFGTTEYPEPMVDLKTTRERAIQVFSSVLKN